VQHLALKFLCMGPQIGIRVKLTAKQLMSNLKVLYVTGEGRRTYGVVSHS